MLEILPESTENLLAVRVGGRHLQEDAHELAELLEARIAKYGMARCFVEISDVHGIDLGALRQGLDFDLHHTDQIERLAIVGDRPWERWLVHLLRLFFRKAEIRYFDASQRDEALAWVREGL